MVGVVSNFLLIIILPFFGITGYTSLIFSGDLYECGGIPCHQSYTSCSLANIEYSDSSS